MEIQIKGTEKEIELAKETMNYTCIFNSEYCDLEKENCDSCVKKNKLKINYIVEESEGK